jgi:predicted GNAT family acetyltransferase
MRTCAAPPRALLVRAAAAARVASIISPVRSAAVALHRRTMAVATAAAGAGPTIEHDLTQHRIFAALRDASGGVTAAELTYTLAPPSPGVGGGRPVMDIDHTFVPPAGRGLGLAGKLADAAFAWAAGGGYAVRPTCSYIRETYLPKKKGWAMGAADGVAVPQKLA